MAVVLFNLRFDTRWDEGLHEGITQEFFLLVEDAAHVAGLALLSEGDLEDLSLGEIDDVAVTKLAPLVLSFVLDDDEVVTAVSCALVNHQGEQGVVEAGRLLLDQFQLVVELLESILQILVLLGQLLNIKLQPGFCLFMAFFSTKHSKVGVAL